jgi:hypothetical protein
VIAVTNASTRHCRFAVAASTMGRPYSGEMVTFAHDEHQS